MAELTIWSPAARRRPWPRRQRRCLVGEHGREREGEGKEDREVRLLTLEVMATTARHGEAGRRRYGGRRRRPEAERIRTAAMIASTPAQCLARGGSRGRGGARGEVGWPRGGRLRRGGVAASGARELGRLETSAMLRGAAAAMAAESKG